MLNLYWKRIKISALILSFFISGCSLFEKEPVAPPPPTARELLFQQAEELYQDKNFEQAQPLYSKISRNSDGNFDPIYDKALWRLSKVYEKRSEPAKALLALEELAQKKSSIFSKIKIRFAQLKNHFTSENMVQALEIKKEIDLAYKSGQFGLTELYDCLLETSDLNYKHHLLQEAEYLGEVQKYYIFIIESRLAPANINLANQLMDHYNQFISVLDQGNLTLKEKKQLTISLIDQLAKVNRYQLDDFADDAGALKTFAIFSQKQYKKLTESLHKL